MVGGRRVGDEGRALRQDSRLLWRRCRDVQCAAGAGAARVGIVVRFVAKVVGQGSLEGCRILGVKGKAVSVAAAVMRR